MFIFIFVFVLFNSKDLFALINTKLLCPVLLLEPELSSVNREALLSLACLKMCVFHF